MKITYYLFLFPAFIFTMEQESLHSIASLVCYTRNNRYALLQFDQTKNRWQLDDTQCTTANKPLLRMIALVGSSKTVIPKKDGFKVTEPYDQLPEPFVRCYDNSIQDATALVQTLLTAPHSRQFLTLSSRTRNHRLKGKTAARPRWVALQKKGKAHLDIPVTAFDILSQTSDAVLKVHAPAMKRTLLIYILDDKLIFDVRYKDT